MGNDKALMATIFSTWLGHQLKMKSEKHIRDKFEAEIEHAEATLMAYKQNQMNNVRNVLMRKAAEGDGNLMTQVWKHGRTRFRRQSVRQDPRMNSKRLRQNWLVTQQR